MLPFSELIGAAGDTPDTAADSSSLVISGITSDSRQVKPGYLFAALAGSKQNGEAYIQQALAAGASAVLCQTDANVPASVKVLRSANPRRSLALMAARFYGAQPKHLAAVTGTDGKTSTADFARQFWHGIGKASASIGTLGVLVSPPPNGEGISAAHTTPDPVELHRQLAELAGRGIEHVCMEASSHGIHQHRLDGVRFEAAAFTNLGRDHLDYHQTVDAYYEAKAALFGRLLPAGATAVLNADDDSFPRLKTLCLSRGLRGLNFGYAARELRLLSVEPQPYGQRAQVELLGQPYALEIPVAGAFQVMNILAAIGLLIGCGENLDALLPVIPRLAGVPGRLELAARLENGACVFVDYAHTPLALANILQTLRAHTAGRLHVVFGCGGDRDAGKRPQMGEIACRLADDVTVTDDNPRSESPALIRRAILAACPRGKEVADRREAIYGALARLEAGDILVVAGKGHEAIQIIGDKTLPFSDVQIARDAAAAMRMKA